MEFVGEWDQSTEKLRFLRSLKFKLYWASSNYEIADIYQTALNRSKCKITARTKISYFRNGKRNWVASLKSLRDIKWHQEKKLIVTKS